MWLYSLNITLKFNYFKNRDPKSPHYTFETMECVIRTCLVQLYSMLTNFVSNYALIYLVGSGGHVVERQTVN